MKTVRAFFKRHPILMFAILTYLLSWWSVPLVGGRIIPYGPALAALLVLSMTEGKVGVAAWWRRIIRWRIAWYWYLIGPGIVALYVGSAFAFNLLMGSVLTHPAQPPALGTVMMLLLVGGFWEEPGWSGYALPKLQERFAGRPNGGLLAALGTGVLRAIWHIPLYLYGHIPWFDVVVLEIAAQLIIAWLFTRSGGSVPVVMCYHFISNISGAVINASMFTGAEWTKYYATFVILALAIGLVIVWRSGLNLGRGQAQKTLAVADQ